MSQSISLHTDVTSRTEQAHNVQQRMFNVWRQLFEHNYFPLFVDSTKALKASFCFWLQLTHWCHFEEDSSKWLSSSKFIYMYNGGLSCCCCCCCSCCFSNKKPSEEFIHVTFGDLWRALQNDKTTELILPLNLLSLFKTCNECMHLTGKVTLHLHRQKLIKIDENAGGSIINYSFIH